MTSNKPETDQDEEVVASIAVHAQKAEQEHADYIKKCHDDSMAAAHQAQRQHFAAMAMQGMIGMTITNVKQIGDVMEKQTLVRYDVGSKQGRAMLATHSVAAADALLEALAKRAHP